MTTAAKDKLKKMVQSILLMALLLMFSSTAMAEDAPMTSLQVATYNINRGNNWAQYLKTGKRQEDLSGVIHTLQSLDADIIALNEVLEQSPASGQAQQIAQELGMHHVFIPSLFPEKNSRDKRMYGNALLSRFPIQMAYGLPIKASPLLTPQGMYQGLYYEDRSLLVAEIVLADESILTVLVTHVGLQEAEKVLAMDMIGELIAASKTPVLLLGDLNMEPQDSHILTLSALLQQAVGPEGELLTYPAHQPSQQLDYIFAPLHWAVQAVHTVQSLASDHLPLLAQLAWPK